MMTKLNELTIKQSIQGLINGDFSSQDLVLACLSQIQKYDAKVQAFITVIDESELLNQAKKADELILNKGASIFDEYPLLGIPYAAKDNFSTKEIKTTAASNILVNYIPPYESTVTKRLQDAGAILIGKTNMDAFAHGSSTEESDFFTTKNPWDVSKVPGGSSGGSAAALVSDMCIFAIGSETGGSIRCPASWCGITGYKPTYGRVSRYGLIAMCSSTDCPGPMTKSVWDSAYILQIIAGLDSFDATTSKTDVDLYAEEIDIYKVKNLKIGLASEFMNENIGISTEIVDKLQDFTSFFKQNSLKVQDVSLLDPKYALAVYTIIQRSEVSSNLARFTGVRYGETRDAFGYEAKKRMMLGAYALSSGYYDAYSKAQRVRTLLIQNFNKVFEEVDLIVMPTMPTTALDIGASSTSPIFGELTDMLNLPSAMAGLPAVSVNCGFSKDGLPIGAQIIGKQFDDLKVLSLANFYEQNAKIGKFKPNLEKLL